MTTTRKNACDRETMMKIREVIIFIIVQVVLAREHASRRSTDTANTADCLALRIGSFCISCDTLYEIVMKCRPFALGGMLHSMSRNMNYSSQILHCRNESKLS